MKKLDNLPPLEDPQATLSPSIETSMARTAPSCLASRKNSEKSKGQTLKNWSSLPVTQKPADTLRAVRADSCTLNTLSNSLVK